MVIWQRVISRFNTGDGEQGIFLRHRAWLLMGLNAAIAGMNLLADVTCNAINHNGRGRFCAIGCGQQRLNLESPSIYR